MRFPKGIADHISIISEVHSDRIYFHRSAQYYRPYTRYTFLRLSKFLINDSNILFFSVYNLLVIQFFIFYIGYLLSPIVCWWENIYLNQGTNSFVI